MKKPLLISFVTLLSLFAIFFIGLRFFFKPIVEYALHHEGFDTASVGSAEITTHGTFLKNVALDDLGTTIDSISLFATGDDIRAGRLGKVVISGAHLHWPMTLPPALKKLEEKSGDTSSAASGPLNLHVRDVQFEKVEASVVTPAGILPLEIEGSLIEKTKDYCLSATVQGDADIGKAKGALTVSLDKYNGTARLDYKIDEARVTLPMLQMKRVTGWISAEKTPGKPLPAINAQISIGSALAYGVPLQGATLTASSKEGQTEFIAKGQVQNDSGDVMVDFKADQTDAKSDKVKLTAETKLKNLDAFKIPGLNGQGSLLLSLAGTRAKTAGVTDMANWETLGGSLGVNMDKLSLPGLLNNAQALATLKLGYDPAAEKITAQAVDGPVGFKGTMRKLDARPLYLNIPLGDKPATLSWEGKTHSATLDVTGAVFAGADMIARDISAHVTAYLPGHPVFDGQIAVGQLSHNSTQPYFIPVGVSLQISPLDKAPNMTGFAGVIRDPNALIDAKIAGTYNSEAQNGSIVLNMPPKALRQNLYSLANLFPYSSNFIDNGFGDVGMSADIDFADVDGTWSVQSRGQLYLKDFTCMVAGNTIDGINGVINLDNLAPLQWKKQTLAIGSINVGLPLTNGLVVSSLDGNGLFSLHSAKWELAGGHITSSPFSMKLSDLSTNVTLQASGLDLGQLFQIAPMDGLEATGSVDGTLPLAIRSGAFTIVNGDLHTTSPGVISYKPQEVPAFLQSSSQSLIDLKVALSSFHYDSLGMTLNGQLDKTQQIGLHVKGKNPLFYSGHPVNFNLNVEGPIENLIKYNPGNARIPDSIRQQLAAYEAHNAKK
ncbi:MAG: hypothetical protein GC185_03375 [Alphaproteobacteria bacterium]|nr:hypothetical protein [Alphaproteobacteria bacterium]